MSKSIFLFKINNNFISLQKENNLDIILDTFIKSKTDYFYSVDMRLVEDNSVFELKKLIFLTMLKNNYNDF